MKINKALKRARQVCLEGTFVVDVTDLCRELIFDEMATPEFQKAVVQGALASLLKETNPRSAAAYKGHFTRALKRIH
jgi:hypothetical protein